MNEISDASNSFKVIIEQEQESSLDSSRNVNQSLLTYEVKDFKFSDDSKYTGSLTHKTNLKHGYGVQKW